MYVYCSQCGSKIDIEPSDIIVECPFCKTHLILSCGNTIPDKLLQEVFSPREVRRMIYTNFMSGVGKTVKVKSLSTTFVPYGKLEGSIILKCLAPSISKLYFVPLSLEMPSGDYRFVKEKDFETSEVIMPETLNTSYMGKSENRNLSGIIYLPFFLVEASFLGREIYFSADGFYGEIYCPYLKTVTFLKEKDILRKRFSIHFLSTSLLAFLLFFIFDKSFFSILSIFAFFYFLYLLFKEEVYGDR